MMITISQLFFRIPSFELDLKVKERKSVETSNGDYFTQKHFEECDYIIKILPVPP